MKSACQKCGLLLRTDAGNDLIVELAGIIGPGRSGLNYPTRIACRDDVIRYIFCHDRTCANERAIADTHAGHDKGSRTDEHVGNVKFTAKIAETGTYTAWLHAKWRDTCCNSCS